MKYLIPIAFLLISCSQSWYCKKCLNGATVIHDSITVRDTVITKTIDVDTVFNTRIVHVGDTIIKREGKATIRYIKLPGDTVRLEAECESDTLYIEKKIDVPVEVKVSTGWPLWKVIAAIVAALLAGGFIVKLFGK
jgi:hypothetical protein